jgi:hypothetical protein
MPEPSILDVRLAEIDRRLRTIQSGLAPDVGVSAPGESPPPERPPVHLERSAPVPLRAAPSAGDPSTTERRPAARPPAAPPPPARPPARAPAERWPAARRPAAPHDLPDAPHDLPDASDLIAELRQLTEAHERLLASTRELLASYANAPPRPPTAAQPSVATVRELSVSAGPFTSTEALRGFERALVRLPEVREVAVRGYEGEDRAVVDVHLVEPTS